MYLLILFKIITKQCRTEAYEQIEKDDCDCSHQLNRLHRQSDPIKRIQTDKSQRSGYAITYAIEDHSHGEKNEWTGRLRHEDIRLKAAVEMDRNLICRERVAKNSHNERDSQYGHEKPIN